MKSKLPLTDPCSTQEVQRIGELFEFWQNHITYLGVIVGPTYNVIKKNI